MFHVPASQRRALLALVAGAAIALSACSGTAATPAPTAVPATAAPATAAPATAAPATAAAATAAPATAAPATQAPASASAAASASSGTSTGQFAGRTLNVMINSGYDDAGFHSVTKAFEDATGATVKITYVPFDSLEAKYATIIAAQDSTFDVVEAVNTHWISYAEVLFADIHSLIGADTVADMTTIAAKGDAVYALPNFLDVTMFYWNKEQFTAAGLDPESPPKTFDEWFADCDKLKVAFPKEYCLDFHISSPNTTFAYFGILLNAAGGKVYTDDLKKVAFNTPEGLAALKAFQTMMTKYVDPASWGQMDENQPSARFAQGLLPTMLNWAQAWTTPLSDPKASKVIGKVGVGIVPGILNTASGSMDGWDGFAVSKFSKNQDMGAAFADFWAGVPGQTIIGKGYGTIPTRKSMIATASSGPAGPALKTAAEEYKYPVSRFPSPFYTPVGEVFDVVLHDLASGKIDAQAAMDQLTTKVQQKIDAYYNP